MKLKLKLKLTFYFLLSPAIMLMLGKRYATSDEDFRRRIWEVAPYSLGIFFVQCVLVVFLPKATHEKQGHQ
jgi:hypothetical protein